MNNYFKKIITGAISLIMCMTGLNFAYAASDTINEGVYSSDGDVYVSGRLNEGITCASIIAVEKGAAAPIDKSKIYYLDEVKSNDQTFAFKFRVSKPLAGFDLYVNDGTNKLIKLEDCTGSLYVSTKIDVLTYAESIKYDINFSADNIFGYNIGNCNLFTAIYDKNNALLNVFASDIYLDGNTKTARENITLALEDLTDKASYVKVFAWNDMRPMTSKTNVINGLNEESYRTIKSDVFLSCDDKAIYYGGRWLPDTENQTMTSNWARPYVRVKLSYKNGQSVKFKFKRTSDTVVQVYVNGEQKDILNLAHEWRRDPDDGTCSLVDVSGKLSEGMNDVMVLFPYVEATQVPFCGVKIGGCTEENVMTLYEPKAKTPAMMFIGDSITSANNGYSMLVPMQLGADFATISRSGIALRDGKSYFTPSDGEIVGMESRFNYYESVGNGAKPIGYTEFPFNDSYDIIFVNLGTNDKLTSEVGSDDANDFVERYNSFINHVRSKYPNSEIVIIRPFNGGVNASETRKKENKNRSDIFADMYAKGYFTGDKLHYCDTTEWTDVEYMTDELHPSENGHKNIAERLMSFLKNEGLVK